MKIFICILFCISSTAFASETKISNAMQPVVSDSSLQADIDSNLISNKNKSLAEFGELVVSKSFTYAKSVRDVNGNKIVDVVIVDKLCHVTVDDRSGEMQASKIECDKGRYFPASAKSN